MSKKQIDLERTLELAKLKVSDDETGSKVETLKNDLDRMLNCFDKINELDNLLESDPNTKGLLAKTEPLICPVADSINNRFYREDVKESTDKDSILDQSPELQGDLYRVPQVIN